MLLLVISFISDFSTLIYTQLSGLCQQWGAVGSTLRASITSGRDPRVCIVIKTLSNSDSSSSPSHTWGNTKLDSLISKGSFTI